MLTLNLELQYVSELAPEVAERRPILMAYIDGNFERQVVEVPLSRNDPTHRYTVRLEGKLREEYKDTIPSDSKVVFYATVETQNDFGAPCRVDAGVASIPLASIHNNGSGAGEVIELPLTLHSVGNYEKGRLRVRTHKDSVQLLGSDIHFDRSLDVRTHMIASQGVEAELSGYLNEFMRTENEMPNAIRGTDNIRCPI